MPELPEVEIARRRLAEKTLGKRIEHTELASVSALKTFDPPLRSLEGRIVSGTARRGKYIALEAEGLFLVFHLAKSGWIRWRNQAPKGSARMRRGPLALRVLLEDGSGFELTEMATEKRLGIWVVTSLDAVEGVATLGPDPLGDELTAEVLGQRLSEQSGDLKHALSRQSVIAGIGNAYSDEVLHAARLSPFRPAARLTGDEVEHLYESIRSCLTAALTHAEALDLEDLKDAKRTSMRVHGRTGESCPVCGDVVREVSFATRSLQYCATCQTNGKPLADRRLSRLLK